MKSFYPPFFTVVIAGIIILGALYFILPADQSPSAEQGNDAAAPIAFDLQDLARKKSGKAALSGCIYSPQETPMALVPFWCRLFDNEAIAGGKKEWYLGPFTTGQIGDFLIHLDHCGDAEIEIFVKGFGPARKRLGPTPPGKRYSGMKFILSPGVTVLKGKVVDREGKPLPGLILELTNPDLRFNRERFLTDESGCFEIKAGSVSGAFSGRILKEQTGKDIPLKRVPAGTLDLVVVFE